LHVIRHLHLVVFDGPGVFGLLSMRDLTYHLIRHGEGRLEAEIRSAGGDAAG